VSKFGFVRQNDEGSQVISYDSKFLRGCHVENVLQEPGFLAILALEVGMGSAFGFTVPFYVAYRSTCR
jgi:hypothetical protein